MKNEYKIDGQIVCIYLKNINDWTIIDIRDFDRANEFKGTWYGDYSNCVKGFYVKGTIGRKSIRLHRWILGVSNPKIHVDHKNHKTLDNTRGNIREVTITENNRNRSDNLNNTSGFRGVSWEKRIKKWKAQITVNGKKISLGYYNIAENASSIYQEAKNTYHEILK
jgi:hypothetical protein